MVKIEVAEPKDRFVAAAIDFVPPFLLFLLFAVVGANGMATITSIVSALYFVGRDALGNGQSLGKRMRNLQVVDADTDRVPDMAALLLRNLGFLVPGLNAIYAIVEGVQVLRHPQGLRFGDVFAQTGVVKVPKEEREKLLVRPTERKSRDNIPKVEAPVDAVAPAATPAAAAPAAKPAGFGPIPGFGGAPASSAPKKAPSPIDLPPDTSSAPSMARPSGPPPIGTPPPPKPAASPDAAPLPPIPGAAAAGIAMSDDDPLKKLIEKAGAKS